MRKRSHDSPRKHNVANRLNQTLFSIKTMEDFSQRIANLSPEKRALLERQLMKKQSIAAKNQEIPRRGASDPRSLSFAQQRLWFLDQLEPNSLLYNISRAVRLRGSLNVQALQQALDAIVARHEALRTTFAAVDGNPVQVIAKNRLVELPVMDLNEHPDTECEMAVQRLLKAEAQRPFNLAQDVMLRATLLRLGETEHVLLLTVHHIAADGWSMGVLCRELSLLYDAFSTGSLAPLPQLPIQYADFARWQRQWLQGDVLNAQLSYWKQQLGGNLPVLALPTDRPRPPIQTFRGAEQSLVLSGPLSESIKSLSRREDVTLFVTLLAAFNTLLHRYTGQVEDSRLAGDDIVVGSPIANRNRMEIEGLIGFFVNTLVLHTDLSGNPTFRQLLCRVREVALGAYAHQDLPFEKLVEELQPERDLSRNPLFDVMFILQNAPSQPLALSGVTVSPLAVENEAAKFDLTLSLVVEAEGLRATLEYNTDLFNRDTITRLLGHYHTLLQGIVANPEQRLSDLPLLTAAEQHQLLVRWNDTQTDYPRDLCVHHLFEAQVESTPYATALVFDNQQLTYQELNAQANQLAHALIKRGVKPDVLVGICVTRSVEMVIGLLGILKAGGVYVPLDPMYPSDRLAFMLSDTQTPVLLTQQRLLEELPAHQAKVICLDSEWEVIAQESEENPISSTSAENLAYVIYTSGSTGTPKGVSMSHRPLCNLLWWQLHSSTHPRGTRTLQFASLNFDVSFQELFSTWYAGGTLVLIAEELQRDAVGLLHLLKNERVERLFLPFVALQQLAGAVAHHAPVPTCLREVITAGEQLRITQQIVSFFSRLKDCQLYNQYGPSESHVVTAFNLTGPPEDWPTLPPLGRPIANTQIYLLDSHLHPVPAGIPGELYIGGVGLARGYLNHPKLTAEKFIPNPFSEDAEARLYKTGDLARYLPDGNIEFLGRLDHQVKIRGFRIELGEIETVLSQHTAVRENVVMAWEDSPGDKRLVAYLVPAVKPPPTVSELRSFLREKLPEYMVPSVFMFLDALPLTPNSKVDRRALPAPDQTRPELKEAFVPPRTPVEELIACIWAEVLGVKQVGAYDNFFELGGHSLLATQVISRMRDIFPVELPLRRIFETHTVAGIAESIGATLRAESGCRVLPLHPTLRDGELPLSFAQQRLWFLNQFARGNSAYNVPAAIRLTGMLNVAALEQSINKVLRRHQALRTTFSSIDGQPVQLIASSLTLGLPVIDLQQLPKAERESKAKQLADEEAQQPFNLAKGPLVRARLLRLAEEEHILLLTMHHIASDGWSRGVLFRELSALYGAFSLGKPSPLAELPIQYADFAHWQREWLQGEVLETQLSYWKQQLGGNLPVLELPTDRPRPPVQTFRGARQSLMLPKSLGESLKALSQREGCTLFMVLLTAFKTLLHRYTGQVEDSRLAGDDIVVGSPIANRNRVEIEGLIGFFVNTLVLRTDLSGNPAFRELLARVREVAFGAYAHQDLPFEKLVEELHPQRDMSRNPLFDVMFAFQNAPKQELALSGLTPTPLRVDSGTTKFDLTLSLTEESHGLRATLEYNTDLFNRDTITRLREHYHTMLQGIVAHPEQRLSDLPLLTAAERHQLLVVWNDTQTDYPRDLCVHHLFEAQVERTPDATALVFDNQQLTYRELNAQANQLAHALIKRGIKPDVLVGICVNRSVEMVIGLLGILKAGGAYVPLEPMYPTDRLAFMLNDTQAPVLLTQQRLLKGLPPHETEVICLDSEWEVIAQESMENPVSGATADSLAYAMYTSGSTGKPKGVSVPHCAITRLVCNTNYIKLAPSDRVGQAANCSFDAATFELWGALFHGACIIGIAREVILSPHDFAAQIREREISVLFLTTALFNQLADEVPWAFNSVRYLLFGGEVVSPRWVKAVLKNGPPERLLHVYGPTENTTFTVWYEVTDVPEGAKIIPIGRPISNTQVYVLDHYRQPVPVGVPGELCIAGMGLARGYLNHPELTTEKFIPNPFSEDAEARLYRTGDLVRYLPDGNIEFLGRLDHQVKIRGFRVELGEIEAVLSQHTAVREAVVLAREDIPGDKRLVAYFVSDQEPPPTVGELRRFLKEELPDYMMPAVFTLLNALPLTPNGKVDRRALPIPDSTRPDSENAFVAPRDELELQLTRIWEELFDIRQIGVRDDFFELGGHSLLAVRLFAQIEKVFGKNLPLATFFQVSTIEQMAIGLRQKGEAVQVPTVKQEARPLYAEEFINDLCIPGLSPGIYRELLAILAGWKGRRAGPRALMVELHSSGSKPPFFWCAVHFEELVHLAKYLGVEQPIYGLPPMQEPTEKDIKAVAACYVNEILAVQPEGPYLLGGYCVGGFVAFETAQQLHAQGKKVALLSLVERTGPGRIYHYYRRIVGPFAHHWGQLSQLSPHEQLTYVLETAKRVIPKKLSKFTESNSGHPSSPGEQTMPKYVPQAYPGRVSLFFGHEGGLRSPLFPRAGWNRWIIGDREAHVVPGDHVTIFKEPYVRALAEKLKACLDKAQRDNSEVRKR